MIRNLNGYTVKIYRAKSRAGWSDLYYSCFRDSDKFEVCSGCGALLGTDSFWTIYHYIKGRIASYDNNIK